MSLAPSSCTLLVVHDSAVDGAALRALLEPLAREVVVADGQSDVPALVAAHAPALAIMDVHLPAEHGLRRLAALRQVDAQLPVVVIGPYGCESVPAQRA